MNCPTRPGCRPFVRDNRDDRFGVLGAARPWYDGHLVRRRASRSAYGSKNAVRCVGGLRHVRCSRRRRCPSYKTGCRYRMGVLGAARPWYDGHLVRRRASPSAYGSKNAARCVRGRKHARCSRRRRCPSYKTGCRYRAATEWACSAQLVLGTTDILSVDARAGALTARRTLTVTSAG